MIFAFFLLDRPGARELRLEKRPEHKEYLAKVGDQISFAGPLKNDDDSEMVGSLLVIDFPNREEAQKWMHNEPFYRYGVYASASIYPFENLWHPKK
ncbi:MAG: YciI family protein [Betaproteobacteria bacterium]|jgi:uncharacterized protein YciI